MITIPYKEYQELQTYKKIANSDNERVYIKEEAESLGNFYSWWFVYTKDQAVRDLSDKLNEARIELEDIKEGQRREEESESDFPYSRMFWLLVGLMSLYIVVQIIEPIFK